MSTDKAGKSYWDQSWERRSLPSAVDPRGKGLNHYVSRKFHAFFRETFAGMDTKEKRLLEIGCAGSSWLPYFAKEFGFKAYGLDYSALGCQQARQILRESGVEGEVVCADFFAPPAPLKGAFDVVVSFGVVEHFENTSACLQAISEFLKPGGIAITNIPNMVGLIGSLQKAVNRSVFDIHVPLDACELQARHTPHLRVVSCRYFLFMNLSAVNIGNRGGRLLNDIGARVASWISKGCWVLEDIVPVLKPNWVTSPYINCVARKT